MNLILFTVSLMVLCVTVIHGFFLFKGMWYYWYLSGVKLELKTAWYCLKVCPLYCPNRSKRDADVAEAVTVDPIYFDTEEVPWESWDDSPEEIEWSALPFTPYLKPHVDWHEFFSKKTTTTTTEAPTTKEPTYICYLCKKKCEGDKK